MFNKTKLPSLSEEATGWLAFLGVSLIFVLLIVPTVNDHGISWDEEIDLRIARAYLSLRGFFFGLPLDNTQTRLPMFAVSLVYSMLGVNDLFTARIISVIVGWLTLLAVFTYGKIRFSWRVGLLAAGLLATSPFFLSFARVAFTESDIYLACTLAWFLVAVAILQEKPTIGRAAVAGLLLGLSIAAKVTVIVIIPTVWIALFAREKMVRNRDVTNDGTFHGSSLVPSRVVLLWAAWAIFVLLLGIFGGIKLNIASYSSIYRLIHYGLVCIGWGILFIWVFSVRNHTARAIPLAGLLTAIGSLTFLIFPPEHLTNGQILHSLFSRAGNELSFSLAYAGELAALHTLAVLFKSTLFIGLCLLISAFVSILQWRQVGLLPVLVFVFYFLGLLLLPLGQTFYAVPILPILAVLAGYWFMWLWSRYRSVAFVLIILAASWWSVEMIQSYPDYHLNGYQWLGQRVLFGRSSIGYRSVVFTPADGVQQAVEWLNVNVAGDQVVQLYVAPLHIVRYLAPDPAYRLSNGHQDTLLSRPDFVVVHINDTIWSGNGRETPVGSITHYPYDKELLEREYEKVFHVRRAFDIEMISIWKRK